MEDNDVIEKLLRENIALNKDTNRIVRKMRRDAVVGRYLRLLTWVVILGIPFLLYNYIFKDYIKELDTAVETVQSFTERLQPDSLLQRVLPSDAVEQSP